MLLRSNLIIGIGSRDGPQGGLEGTKSFFDRLISATGRNPSSRILEGALCPLL
jgi:hypothetical protein